MKVVDSSAESTISAAPSAGGCNFGNKSVLVLFAEGLDHLEALLGVVHKRRGLHVSKQTRIQTWAHALHNSTELKTKTRTEQITWAGELSGVLGCAGGGGATWGADQGAGGLMLGGLGPGARTGCWFSFGAATGGAFAGKFGRGATVAPASRRAAFNKPLSTSLRSRLVDSPMAVGGTSEAAKTKNLSPSPFAS